MEEMKVGSDIRNNEKLRNSFNELASITFGIDFESWYRHGYWSDKYIPYSLVVEEQIVANVSVNLVNIIVEGKDKKAIQIGTVMTHPNYRNLGYSRLLLEKVLEEYSDYDLIYLYANPSVLNFYPKFGFKSKSETLFTLCLNPKEHKNIKIRKLDVDNKEDLEFIFNQVKKRRSQSEVFGTNSTEELFMFYCIHVFSNDIYFLEEEEIILIYQIEGNCLHLYDIIAPRTVDLLKIIYSISDYSIKKVAFYFTPDIKDISFDMETFEDDNVLFIKNLQDVQLPKYFKHPITSQA